MVMDTTTIENAQLQMQSEYCQYYLPKSTAEYSILVSG